MLRVLRGYLYGDGFANGGYMNQNFDRSQRGDAATQPFLAERSHFNVGRLSRPRALVVLLTEVHLDRLSVPSDIRTSDGRTVGRSVGD